MNYLLFKGWLRCGHKAGLPIITSLLDVQINVKRYMKTTDYRLIFRLLSMMKTNNQIVKVIFRFILTTNSKENKKLIKIISANRLYASTQASLKNDFKAVF